MNRVGMANSMYIRPGLMNSSVYQEPGSVGTAISIPTKHSTVQINQDHIAGSEETEVHAEWVGPEGIVVLRVTDRDMTRHTFDIAFA